MAKAKKSEPTEKPKEAKKPASKAKPSVASTPLIDTNLAAQSAARMLIAGHKPQGEGPNRSESAMFKQLKAGIAKPASMNPLMDTGSTNFGNKATGFKPNSQSASYHANVAKTGVPRRNPG